MNKIVTKSIAVAILVLIPVVSFASPAPENTPMSTTPPSSSSVSTVASAPATTEGSSTSAPATGMSGSTATPSTGSSGSTATPPTSDSTSTASPVTPPTPPTPPSSGGSSSSSSSSGSYVGLGYGYGYIQGCPLITSYMKFGGNNDRVQVTKLQSFLKNIEKLDVDVNGIFDKKTESAVIAFQNKYSQVTMGPWGATKGTGYVYITTVKKINQIACNQPLTLNASELSTINARKNRASIIVTATPATKQVTEDQTPSIQVETGNSADVTFVTTENEDNTASVGKASIMNRFWNFIVYLFK